MPLGWLGRLTYNVIFCGVLSRSVQGLASVHQVDLWSGEVLPDRAFEYAIGSSSHRDRISAPSACIDENGMASGKTFHWIGKYEHELFDVSARTYLHYMEILKF